jgi:hypothetical protein
MVFLNFQARRNEHAAAGEMDSDVTGDEQAGWRAPLKVTLGGKT